MEVPEIPSALEAALGLAKEVRDLLRSREQRLVLAESCTAGRVAATLSVFPGISQWLCGSFVVYRSSSKAAWLGVAEHLLYDPQIGPVSAETSRSLAAAALERTPEAHWAIAVTGDVGPGAPQRTDGAIYLACAARIESDLTVDASREQRISLRAPAPRDDQALAARLARLEEATEHVLRFAADQLRRA